jgi:xanthine/uracil/vitamin C permease (AzgA family)
LWAAGAAVAIRIGIILLAPPSDLLASLLMAPVSGALTALATLPVYALLSRSAATEGP